MKPPEAIAALTLSVIVPCCDDPAVGSVDSLRALLLPGDEIIIADASAPAFADEWRPRLCQGSVRWHACTRRGRGCQLLEAAALARGDILVFNHADSFFTAEHAAALRRALAEPDLMCGAFFKDTAAHYPLFLAADGFIRWWMQHFGIVYGDQTLFIRRSHYEATGGFRDLPLMEDVDYSDRLRRAGGFRLIAPPLRTSMRRFARRGLLLTRLQNVAFVWLFRLGVPADTLYRWYYGRRV